ncbi:hypothetical protein DOM21_03185 [Bacteriovorax stolpii]|uniref:Uncharacterized protein n=1 Tax=Bacteriovorax stolpii TaxID=960 RepID=A0A2K9NVI8_BACTC|nr:hypothetical protein [Bacteriovorax stolpii]AUN99531.1 hypothetical protein C0V70_15750 [Bacteriovorax stolpii]QDK40475.1 hypothetical protein DOM21_03185 [Bacteriovorax stolpii]TDP51160.1 hypothetical protein C8D79_3331 [Bacteriovorax stolpii]
MKMLLATFFLSFNAQAMEIYILNTQIGATTFKDLLIMENGKGSLTVPGQFTTPLLNYERQEKSMSFNFSTTENGAPLKGSYLLHSEDEFKSLKGELMIGSDHFPITGGRVYVE